MRRLLSILLAIAAGAGVSVLVAWACAVWVDVKPKASRADTGERLLSFIPAAWLVPARAGIPGYSVWPAMHMTGSTPGVAVESCSIMGGWTQLQVTIGELRAFRAGWPLVCLESIEAKGWTPYPSDNWGQLAIPKWLQKPPTRRYRPFLPSTEPAIPLRPIPVPLALDTIVYAAVLWVLVAGPKAARRGIRRRRGRCPTCGYDMRGLAAATTTCPECGSSGTARPKTTPLPDDASPQGRGCSAVLAAGCILVVLGLAGLLGVAVYFVVMDPRSFLEKVWIGFFAGGSLVVALGGFLVARSLRMRRARARRP